jgi:Flp pilus assembly protein TadG
VNDRAGTAAVEFAVCLPLIVMLVLGSIEMCSMIHLKHTLRITAYETARLSARPLSVLEQTQAHGQSLLAAQQVQSGQVVVATEAVPEGTLVSVTVTAPTDVNKIIPTSLFSPRMMQAKCCMLCE